MDKFITIVLCVLLGFFLLSFVIPVLLGTFFLLIKYVIFAIAGYGLYLVLRNYFG